VTLGTTAWLALAVDWTSGGGDSERWWRSPGGGGNEDRVSVSGCQGGVTPMRLEGVQGGAVVQSRAVVGAEGAVDAGEGGGGVTTRGNSEPWSDTLWLPYGVTHDPSRIRVIP
jgi:hypothetical protein